VTLRARPTPIPVARAAIQSCSRACPPARPPFGSIDTITDFTHGVDKIDLRGQYTDLGTSIRDINYTYTGTRL
jgi:hypothetical protein